MATAGMVSFLDPPEEQMRPAPPQHRRNDRPTSVAAAKAQKPGLTDKRLQILRGLLEVDRTSHGQGATAYELMLHLAYSGHAPAQNIVVKVLGDLRSMGLAFEPGDTRMGGAGKQLIVFRPTQLGADKATGSKES